MRTVYRMYGNRNLPTSNPAKGAFLWHVYLRHGWRFLDMPANRAATISSKSVRRDQAFAPILPLIGLILPHERGFFCFLCVKFSKFGPISCSDEHARSYSYIIPPKAILLDGYNGILCKVQSKEGNEGRKANHH